MPVTHILESFMGRSHDTFEGPYSTPMEFVINQQSPPRSVSIIVEKVPID